MNALFTHRDVVPTILAALLIGILITAIYALKPLTATHETSSAQSGLKDLEN